MRIDSGYVGMDSARTYESTEFMVTRFSASRSKDSLGDNFFSDLLGAGDNESEATDERSEVSVDELRDRISNVSFRPIKQADDFHEQMRKLREECINLLLRILFPDIVEHYSASEDSDLISLDSSMDFGNSQTTTFFSFQKQYYYEESENTVFNAKGIVNCADGRQIDIDLNLNMSRSFAEFYAEDITFIENSFTDPLVINFDGPAAAVSDQTFYFDIDSDGVEDEISKLIAGSGFLALDLNEDGIINDGSELFGTASQDGFADLASYDTDHDGWIDEDDTVYDKLKIWAADESGNMQLYSLSDKGVGAISLRSIPTGFYLNSPEDNSQNAIIRQTGVFLFENGRSGTVQQLDFAKHQRAVQAYA